MGNAGSVRFRLLAIALLPTLVVLPVFFAVTAWNWSGRFDELLITKVNSELTIASEYMNSILDDRSLRVGALANSARLAATTDDELPNLLSAERNLLGLDFLYAVGPGERGKWPIINTALAGTASNGIDIFASDDLRAISPTLASRARIPLVPTRAAVPTTRSEENRAMILHIAAPLPDGAGALVGGVLLNRNLGFIDTINDLVYPTESLPEDSQGTATLFLEDVRVSTNVRLFQDERALGTRVSAIVRSAVLDEGRVWLDRAFVVNDWYISAYEPIIDTFGNRVGMLYVGFLEAPFETAKRRTIAAFAFGFVAIMVLTIPIYLRWAAQIFRPLETTLATMERVEHGDLGARTDVEASSGEITRVAAHLDDLLDQIEARDKKLRAYADDLNARVAERTAELEEANKNLEATSQQLIVSEKLASLGEIAAGLAHEINNPVAVIQGNVDLLQSELAQTGDTHKTEFQLINEQIQAINMLVSKILKFTRPDEFADFDETHVPSTVIRDTLPLINHLLGKAKIDVDLHLDETRPVRINRTELQQVLINLMVNAIHAMPRGGVLGIRATQDGRGTRMIVSDTGTGMPPDVRARVFDPFFTTKQGGGTGLGLSITRQILERYGGRIDVSSTEGEGTQFTLWLPDADD